MLKIAGSAAVLLSFCYCSFAQIRQNSIGICYLDKDTADEYHLTIILPIQASEKTDLRYREDLLKPIDSLTHAGQIILFDGEGEIYSINTNQKFLITFWCDNDGGTQYRPTLKLIIKKKAFSRPLKTIRFIDNICCVVLVNLEENRLQEEENSKRSTEIALSGDYNQNGKPECAIYTFRHEGESCDGKLQRDRIIQLQVGHEFYKLVCCQP